VVLALLLPSLFYHFTGEDYVGVLRLATTNSASKAFEFRWPVSQTCAYFRPLQWLPFMLGYSLAGLPIPPDPGWQAGNFLFGYHLLNLLLHLTNILLIYVIARYAFNSVFYATLASSIFALHPKSVDSACQISVFCDLLFACFALSTIILFVFSYKGSQRTKTGLYYLLSFAVFVIALLTKETASFLPILLILTVLYLRQKGAGEKKSIWSSVKPVLPFFLVIPVYLILYKLFLGSSCPALFVGFNQMTNLFSRLAFYAKGLVSPFDFECLKSFIYGHSMFPSVTIAVSILAIVLFFIIIVRSRKLPNVFYALSWVGIAFLFQFFFVFSSLGYSLYFALMGFSLFLVSLVSLSRKRIFTALCLLLYVFLLAIASIGRIQNHKLCANVVRDGLIQLKRDLPEVEPGSVICLVGLPGTFRNMSSFYPAAVEKVRLLYRGVKELDIFCVSTVTFTQKSIKESHFEFIDDYNFIQSLESNPDEFIFIPASYLIPGDSAWQWSSPGKVEYKVLGRNRSGSVEIAAFRLLPEAVKGKYVYLVGYKDNKVGVIKKNRIN
jgi:hypothetical protein